MNYESYVIPPNFTDAGKVLGLFEIRNLIETVLFTVPIVYLCLVLIPFGITTKIIITLSVTVPIGGFGLIGIGGDSLTRWLRSWWNWRKQRRIMLYRGEAQVK